MKFRFLDFLLLFFLIVLFNSVSAFSYETYAFSSYESNVKILSDDTIQVQKLISLRNIHTVGIVPGQVEFILIEGNEGGALELSSYEVKNRYGEDIKSQLRKTEDQTVILLDIFTPVLPGFDYNINLTYVIENEPSGFLFKRLEIPLKEEFRIRTFQGKVSVEIPDSRSFTYLSFQNEKTSKEDNLVTWEYVEKDENIPNSVLIEYSRVPLWLGFIPGSLFFWILINLLLFTILAIEIRRKIKSFRHSK